MNMYKVSQAAKQYHPTIQQTDEKEQKIFPNSGNSGLQRRNYKEAWEYGQLHLQIGGNGGVAFSSLSSPFLHEWAILASARARYVDMVHERR